VVMGHQQTHLDPDEEVYIPHHDFCPIPQEGEAYSRNIGQCLE